MDLTQKLKAVQLLRLTKAVHAIACILFTHVKPVKYSCVTYVKFTRQRKSTFRLSNAQAWSLRLAFNNCIRFRLSATSFRFVSLAHWSFTTPCSSQLFPLFFFLSTSVGSLFRVLVRTGRAVPFINASARKVLLK